MDTEIESLHEFRHDPEGLHCSNEGREVPNQSTMSQSQRLESPLPVPEIESKVEIGLVSPKDDTNRKTTISSQSPSRQKKTHKRRESKSTSRSETKTRDTQLTMKRHSRKASSTRLPTSPVSKTTTTCLTTSSPNSVSNLTTITALSTIAMHPLTALDTMIESPRNKEKKSKESKRKRAKKSRSSQLVLVPSPLIVDCGSMAGDPGLSTTNESHGNGAVIHLQLVNDIEYQSTTKASQGLPTGSTHSRVQAAKQFLNISRHELPRDQDHVTSDKGHEQKRATKKKLADLSLQRESLHNTKPSSRRSSCSNKPTHRKKTKGSRQSKARHTQNSLHETRDDGHQHQRTSIPKPSSQAVTSPLHSMARKDGECTNSDVSRHERRIAARNQLEAISTHIRHRSHSRSLRTRDTSTRRRTDVNSSASPGVSSHAQSSTLDDDVSCTLMATSPDHVCPQEHRMCLASKSEPTKQTEHREHVLLGSTEVDDEVNSFACSLHSQMSQSTAKELELDSIQDDALQIIKMLPPKLASKNQKEERLTTTTVTGHSRVPSSSLHPKTDLQSFLKHVAVLNDLKALTDFSSVADSAEFVHSEWMNRTRFPTKLQRFQRFFQLKCTLFNILRQEATEDVDHLRQTLLQYYDIEPMDLDFVLEHLALCEQENIDVRWDLVRMIFFPDDETLCNNSQKIENVGHQSMPILGHPSTMVLVSETKRLWHSSEDFPTWNSLSDSVSMVKNHVFDDRCHNDEESIDEQQTSWSPMEEFQEEILELFESVESSMADLPPEQSKERRLVLVQLLQATSEEEAHMTTLSFDDMAEIIRHIRICRKTNTDVQWDMIRDIVFPFGVNSLDSLTKRADGDCSRDCGYESSLGNSSKWHQSFRSVEHVEEGFLRVLDYCDHSSDITGKLWDMTGEDLDLVLQHIDIAIGNDASIRWDLIGDILYPGDPDRQSIFSEGIFPCTAE